MTEPTGKEPTAEELRDLRLLAPGHCGAPDCPPETCSVAKRGRATLALLDAYAARGVLLGRVDAECESTMRVARDSGARPGPAFAIQLADGFVRIRDLVRAARGKGDAT